MEKTNNQVYFYPTFGYKTELKKIAKTCAYSGKDFSKGVKATAEHIKPRSKGGASNAKNYLPVVREWNEARGNMDFKDWFKLHPEIEKYIKKVINDLQGKKVDGIDWSNEVKKTLNEELGKEVFFEGRRKLDVLA